MNHIPIDDRVRTQEDRDPLGLGKLPLLEPEQDGWAQIRASLQAQQRGRRNQRLGIGLAMAACLMLVVGLSLHRPAALVEAPGTQDTVQRGETPAPPDGDMPIVDEAPPLQDLVAMSQMLEQRLRLLRDQTSAMPSESTAYVAEIEDLVARVDGQLGMQPDSLELWTQRVNLMLDLEYLFQHQFEREYGRMASL